MATYPPDGRLAALSGQPGCAVPHSARPAHRAAPLHGDLIATITDNDQGVTATHEDTEYGIMRNPAETGNVRYGWLGAKQRAADTLDSAGWRLHEISVATSPVHPAREVLEPS
jgi:hypothetical protein